MRRFAAVVLAVCTCFLVSGVSAAGGPATKTVVTQYSPAHMRATRTLKGYCWTDSIAVGRADAYRCMAGNSIADPCFIAGNARVACPMDLLKNAGIVMLLTRPLPKKTGPASNNVWAFQLQSGGLCQIGTGTVTEGYPYYCTSPPVCSEPKLPAGAAWFETNCGTPKSATSVTSVRKETVKQVWR